MFAKYKVVISDSGVKSFSFRLEFLKKDLFGDWRHIYIVDGIGNFPLEGLTFFNVEGNLVHPEIIDKRNNVN